MTPVNRKELFLTLEDLSAPGYVDFVGRSLHITLTLKFRNISPIGLILTLCYTDIVSKFINSYRFIFYQKGIISGLRKEVFENRYEYNGGV